MLVQLGAVVIGFMIILIVDLAAEDGARERRNVRWTKRKTRWRTT